MRVQKANSGHPGAPMALAPIAYLLYTRVMKHNPRNPHWFDRDRFVLSAGHASMLLYSMLHLSGYGISLEDLKNFRQLGSPTPGHPEYEAEGAPGVEVTTGPLGQGVGNAVGFALAERMLAARFNRDGHEIVDHFTYAIASDGDMQEGVASEASSLAGHLGLGRLTVFYDDNKIQLAGETKMAFSEDVGKRYEAYGWHVQNLGEDLGLDNVEQAIEAAHAVDDRPSLIILRTHIGFGSPNKQDSQKAHGSPLGRGRGAAHEGGLRLGSRRPLPRAGRGAGALRRGPSSAASRRRRSGTSGSRPTARPDPRPGRAARPVHGGPAAGRLGRRLPRFSPDDKPVATRKASNEVIQWVGEPVPTLVSGSADLEPSTLTEIDDGGSVTSDDYSGRNVHYGVREHGMGAIVNGLNLHGVRAFGATFFNFLDYMKGVGAPGGADAPARNPGVHARLDRPRRGRTHPPARGAPGTPARHAEYQHRSPSRRQRDRARVGVRAGAARRAVRPRAEPPEPPDPRSRLVPEDAIVRGAYTARESSKGADMD